MTEKQLWILITSVLQAGLTAAGFNATNPNAAGFVEVRQGAQPTLTGRPAGLAVLFNEIGGNRYGWVQRTDVVPVHTESQKMESTFQISALAPQDVSSLTWATDPTAKDLVTRAAAIMQSSATIAALQAQHVGIYRVREVREVYFQNDRDQQETIPSADFTLSWNLVDTATVEPIVPPIVAHDYPV